MHHCVGGYWRQCVMDGVRIVHLTMADGERATAQFRLCGEHWEDERSLREAHRLLRRRFEAIS